MRAKRIETVLLIAMVLLLGASTYADEAGVRRSTLAANAALKSMIRMPSGHHIVATAFLAWLHDDDVEPLREIAKKQRFAVAREANVLTWRHNNGVTFYMAMVKDIASSKELIDLLTKTHKAKHLPLYIVQYLGDGADNRGDNVFDVFCSRSTRAISHFNRVYTRKQR